MHQWFHTQTSPRRIAREILPLALIAALFAVGLPPGTADAYSVEPGSPENTIVLQLADQSGVLTGQSLDVEVIPSTDWIEVLEATVHEGPVREIEITFAVARVDVGSFGILDVVARSSSAGFEIRRAVPLEVALAVPEIQRSYAIEECCLGTVGLDPLDLSSTGPALLGNTPNPVRALTDIVFDLGVSGGAVSLRVHDIRGRLLRTIETPPLTPGIHRISWDSRDESGRDLPSGVYFYTVTSGDWSAKRKLQLLR